MERDRDKIILFILQTHKDKPVLLILVTILIFTLILLLR